MLKILTSTYILYIHKGKRHVISYHTEHSRGQKCETQYVQVSVSLLWIHFVNWVQSSAGPNPNIINFKQPGFPPKSNAKPFQKTQTSNSSFHIKDEPRLKSGNTGLETLLNLDSSNKTEILLNSWTLKLGSNFYPTLILRWKGF